LGSLYGGLGLRGWFFVGSGQALDTAGPLGFVW
jgi:hypothetical protein